MNINIFRHFTREARFQRAARELTASEAAIYRNEYDDLAKAQARVMRAQRRYDRLRRPRGEL